MDENLHRIELQLQKMIDHQKFLEEKVEQLIDTVGVLRERIKELENYVTKKSALTNFFSHWYKIPVLAGIIAGIIELIKNKLHF